jgi:NTE family protein
MTTIKTGLVLPGGGAKCAVQVGGIKALIENGVTIDKISSTSGGSLNGALLAQGKTQLLYDLWDETGRTSGSTISKTYLAEFKDGSLGPNVENLREILTYGIKLKDKIGLITKDGQRNFIRKIIENGKSIDKIMDNSPLFDTLSRNVTKAEYLIDQHITLVSLYDGALYTLTQNDFATDHDLHLGLLASSSMPGVWAPIPEIKLASGAIIYDAVDGGLRSSSPLPQMMAAIDMESTWEVFAVNPNSINQMINKTKKNLITQAGSSIDIMLNEGLQRDIKQTLKWNEVALECPEYALKRNLKYAPIHNIEAPMDKDGYPLLGKTLDFRAEAIQKRIDLGYTSMMKHFDSIAA